MAKYSDTSRATFARALDALSEELTPELVEALRALLEEEALHDGESVRRAVEQAVQAVNDGD